MFVKFNTLKKYIICVCTGIITGIGVKVCFNNTEAVYKEQQPLTIICDAGHGGYGKCFKLKSV